MILLLRISISILCKEKYFLFKEASYNQSTILSPHQTENYSENRDLS